MDSDVILLYGAPYTGRTLCYWQEFSTSHKRVCPEEVYKENPSLTIRQLVIKYILTPLKQGEKIVIDDSFQTFTKRDSFINLIKKKLPGLRCLCYVVTPLHGTEQLHWAREYSVAQQAATLHRGETCGGTRADVNIELWLQKQELPEEDEGYSVQSCARNLYAESFYQFEVPCLLIQWEGLFQKKSGDYVLMEGIEKVTSTWYNTNPCGRVIVLSDGSSSVGVTPGEREHLVQDLFKDLIKQISVYPIYVLMVTPQMNRDPYSGPPHPGLLAFLQQTHCLDLQHPGSMYLYHNATHMKMAENAGIKYIKANRVLEHPNLAKSSHATTQPKLPAMLKDLKVLPPVGPPGEPKEEDLSATVPMYEEMMAAEPGTAKCKMWPGRTMYALVRDSEIAQSYKAAYRKHATTTTSNRDSGIRALSRHCSSDQSSVTGDNLNQSKLETSMSGRTRGLPKWMIPGEGSEKQKGSLKRKVSSSLEETTSGSLQFKRQLSGDNSSRMTYVMSADELLEMAQIILAEAGESVPDAIEIQSTVKRMPENKQEGVNQHKVKAGSKPRIVKRPHRDILDELLVKDIDELASDTEENTTVKKMFTEATPAKNDDSRAKPSGHHSDSEDSFLDDLLCDVKPKQRRNVEPETDLTFSDLECKSPEKIPESVSIPATIPLKETLQCKKSMFVCSPRTSSDSDRPDTVLVEESLPTKKNRVKFARSQFSSSDSDKLGNGQSGARRSGARIVPDSLVAETVTTVPETVVFSDRETSQTSARPRLQSDKSNIKTSRQTSVKCGDIGTISRNKSALEKMATQQSRSESSSRSRSSKTDQGQTETTDSDDNFSILAGLI